MLACSLAAGEGVLWAAGCPYIDRISTDRGDLRILAHVPVPFQQPRSAETTRWAMRDLAVGEGFLWVVGDPVDRRVFRVERRTGEILGTTALPFAPRSVAAGEGGVWVTGLIDDVVARLDPGTGKTVQTIDVGRGRAAWPQGPEPSGSRALWIARCPASTRHRARSSREYPWMVRRVRSPSAPAAYG